MTVLQAALLGIVQGITEFFPVSSSGHLVIFQHLFKLAEPQLAFDIVLHLGTLVSILIFLHSDIIHMLKNDRRSITLVVIASIPTFFIGFFFKDLFESFFSMPRDVAALLIINGIMLILATFRSDRVKGAGKDVPTVKDALVIGLAQGVAIIPGISRSGSTISAGILNGVKREAAFRFSFLMAIPAILGATVVKGHKIGLEVLGGNALQFLVGGIIAMLVGLASMKFLLKLVKGNKLHYFGLYCIAFGLIVLIFMR